MLNSYETRITLTDVFTIQKEESFLESLDISTLAPGIYLVKALTRNELLF